MQRNLQKTMFCCLCSDYLGSSLRSSDLVFVWDLSIDVDSDELGAHTPAMRLGILFLAATIFVPQLSRAQAPVFVVTPVQSKVTFNVKASVPIEGKFDKWNATLTFTSPELSTGVLDIEIQAATVDTGSGMKNNKLKGKDFFNVEHDPLITFKSTKVTQTGPATFDVEGTFTIRGVSKTEHLNLTVSGAGTGSGAITGTMAFDRKQYGMNSGIPFIKIADRVEVDIDLKAKRVSGPPVNLKH
jgi:polyisoprenoid-binding protein YceI